MPANIVLVLIAARGLVLDDRASLYIAFFGGLILSFLMQVNLGYYPLLFLLIVKIAALIRNAPVSFNLPVVFFAGMFLIGLSHGLNVIFLQQEFKISIYIIESVILVPVYYLVRFWEERFTVATHSKLRIK